MKIGLLIKSIRQKLGLTQQQLAESLGYSHKSMITKIEKGESDMSYDKMLLFIDKYGLDANTLFFDDQKGSHRHAKVLTIQDISCYGQLIGDILRKMYPDLLAIRGNDALLNTDTSTCNEPNKEDTEV